MNKLLDLRFVIGIFFLVVGVLLLVYSFMSNVSHPVNRWCGVVFIIFSAIMLVFSIKREKEFISETESGGEQ
jgi:drug/metabolite transporter (DMT)-like permease